MLHTHGEADGREPPRRETAKQKYARIRDSALTNHGLDYESAAWDFSDELCYAGPETLRCLPGWQDFLVRVLKNRAKETMAPGPKKPKPDKVAVEHQRKELKKRMQEKVREWVLAGKVATLGISLDITVSEYRKLRAGIGEDLAFLDAAVECAPNEDTKLSELFTSEEQVVKITNALVGK